MSENVPESEMDIEIPVNAHQTQMVEEPVEVKKKLTLRSFIKISGFTITFASIAILLMIIGLILFYRIGGSLRENVGYWMIFAGVILFLLTVVFGFEKIEE